MSVRWKSRFEVSEMVNEHIVNTHNYLLNVIGFKPKDEFVYGMIREDWIGVFKDEIVRRNLPVYREGQKLFLVEGVSQ